MRPLHLLLLWLLLTLPGLAETPSAWGQTNSRHAFTNARLYLSPDQVIPSGTLLIEEGKVLSAGPNLSVPSGFVVHDLKGKVLHPGFIEPYLVASRLGLTATSDGRSTAVSGPNSRIHDDFRVVDALKLKAESFDDLRELGYVAAAVVPEGGIFRGQAALYFADTEANLLDQSVASVVGYDLVRFGKSAAERYPMSAMGHLAAIRQHFLDAAWQPTQERVFEGSVDSVRAVQEGRRPLFAEAESYLQVLQLLSVLKEAQVPRSTLVLSGQEWRELSWLKQELAADQGLIVPLKFPATPKLGPGYHSDQLSLDKLQQWWAAPANPAWLTQSGFEFALTTHRLEELSSFESALQDAMAAGLPQRAALAGLTTVPARLLGVENQLGTLTAGKSASFVIRHGTPLSGAEVEEIWVHGERFPTTRLQSGVGKEPDSPEARDFISPQAKPKSLYPEPFRPDSVLVKNATIWTQGAAGKMVQADMLVGGGKIVKVGPNLSEPAGHIIEARGLHLTPGLVDTHSHTAIDGAVNESSLNVTAMVRMKDVLDPFDHNIYLQLAAGVTTANILHGSANAIGGQAIIVKWRRGESPQGLVMKGVPEGIKFALGENPKQSNWATEQFRYPQSRMGVIESIRGAFVSAKNYRAQKQAGKAPRPDLALEALLEILDGTRLIHCHSYRQDEILALMRLAEEEGFRVKVFQHVLEGYKIGDELAAHGATASTFADWWAYKYEVDDAIPHNASLMAERGVVASVNSDSNDLARRLNTEAAKSMRYGGMDEVEALNLVTRNPAIQMEIEDRVGSLEPGKDADFVLWSAHPLTQEAVCQQTWIEGTRYFHREAEPARVKRMQAERTRLLEQLNSKKKESKS